jgi:5-methylcytosine-specific restriction endonuclease McrA
MPIRESEKHRYPPDWKAISRRVRERAGQKCERCGAPNGVEIKRLISDPSKWMTVSAFVESILFLDKRDESTRTLSHQGAAQALAEAWGPPVKVVLTVMHLNHTPEDVSESNLQAACQRCHLSYDAKEHAKNARATRERKSGQKRLFP